MCAWARDGSLAFGRRNGFLSPGEKFCGYEKALEGLDFAGLANRVVIDAGGGGSALAVYVYMELYGGAYPGAPKTSATCVQKGVYYSNVNRVVLFDVFVQTAPMGAVAAADTEEALEMGEEAEWDTGARAYGVWLPFHTAKAACEALAIPFVQVCFEGTYPAARAWASEHAADPAHADAGMPPLPSNPGEGHVARRVTGHRLLKLKNPAFDDIAHGKTTSNAAGTTASIAAAAGLEYITPGRVASVFSKLSREELTPRNVRALGALVQADAVADMEDPGFVPSKAFGSACCAAVIAELKRE